MDAITHRRAVKLQPGSVSLRSAHPYLVCTVLGAGVSLGNTWAFDSSAAIAFETNSEGRELSHIGGDFDKEITWV